MLLQAERELSASLDQLSTYANGNAAYLAPLLAASQHLGKLSLARDKLVSSGRSELAADVEREVSNIRSQAQAIDALPLLGVVAKSESGSDDFAAMMGIENTEKLSRKMLASVSNVNSTVCLAATRQSLHARAIRSRNAPT